MVSPQYCRYTRIVIVIPHRVSSEEEGAGRVRALTTGLTTRRDLWVLTAQSEESPTGCGAGQPWVPTRALPSVFSSVRRAVGVTQPNERKRCERGEAANTGHHRCRPGGGELQPASSGRERRGQRAKVPTRLTLPLRSRSARTATLPLPGPRFSPGATAESPAGR